MFKEPDSIDLDRQAYRNLAFGYGDHFCLGALHARTIAETALRRVLNASSNIMVITPEHQIVYDKSLIFRSISRLYVELR